jgi:TrmH family RNA methyltransferase
VKNEPIITSTANPRIKEIIALEKARTRKESGLFVLEGVKEIGMAITAGYDLETLLWCPQIVGEQLTVKHAARQTIQISEEIFSRLAIRENSGGLLAVAKSKSHNLNDVALGKNPLVIVLESVEKPGNLGAVLRTADAAGVDAVIICDPQTDLYNPNVIRSGLGSLFTMQVAVTDSASAIAFLKDHDIGIYCTHLEASVPYDTIDFTRASAIVMGTEATGLSRIWTKAATNNIIIPMYGDVDSMNVSVSAAIVTFEAIRQRRAAGINLNSGKKN